MSELPPTSLHNRFTLAGDSSQIPETSRESRRSIELSLLTGKPVVACHAGTKAKFLAKRTPDSSHSHVSAVLARLRSRPGDPEAGMVTAFVVIFTAALLLMAGLVLDGGLALSAKVQAIDDAQAAARAGAQAIDIPLYRATGQITLNPTQASADALRFLAAAGRTGTVAVDGNQVTVTVTITQATQILDVAGIDQLSESGTGTATAEQGDG
jgi:hypothetical protein